MAKGLTTAPLVVWVAAEWYNHPATLKLMSEGHRVTKIPEHPGPTIDLILHPAAHYWTNDFWDYLPAAVTAARRRQREGRRESK